MDAAGHPEKCLLEFYTLDRTPDSVSARVEEHIVVCKACAASLEELMLEAAQIRKAMSVVEVQRRSSSAKAAGYEALRQVFTRACSDGLRNTAALALLAVSLLLGAYLSTFQQTHGRSTTSEAKSAADLMPASDRSPIVFSLTAEPVLVHRKKRIGSRHKDAFTQPCSTKPFVPQPVRFLSRGTVALPLPPALNVTTPGSVAQRTLVRFPPPPRKERLVARIVKAPVKSVARVLKLIALSVREGKDEASRDAKTRGGQASRTL